MQRKKNGFGNTKKDAVTVTWFYYLNLCSLQSDISFRFSMKIYYLTFKLKSNMESVQ